MGKYMFEYYQRGKKHPTTQGTKPKKTEQAKSKKREWP
jgi:hypothetical protein